jgi:glycosyltransferase involved in cell wall biosynthesis
MRVKSKRELNRRLLLTASLIVKNEEKFLGVCLDSLQGVADEIVVLDTGSTDRSREIAKSAGARLYEFSWTGDFSEARNHALDLSSGQWILYIDADERVRSDSAGNLRAELSDPGYAAYEILLHPRPGHTAYRALRLFRNDPSIRFRGLIHENIWPAVSEYSALTGAGIGKSALELDHQGYEGDLTTKNVRNLQLLVKALQEDPEHVFSWCHLASTHMEMKETELAKKAWLTALELVRRRWQQKPEDILPYLALIHDSAAFECDADVLLDEALWRFKSSVQLEWLRARKLMNEGRFEEAILAFQGFVELGKTGDYDRTLAYDIRLFNVFAYEALAMCHFRLRQYSASRHYYDLAAQHDPNRLEYRVKRTLCERLERIAGGTPAGA